MLLGPDEGRPRGPAPRHFTSFLKSSLRTLSKNLKLKKLQTKQKQQKSRLITCHCYGFVQTKATSLENEIVFSKPIKNRQIQNDKAAMT